MSFKSLNKLLPNDIVAFINEEINVMKSELDRINNNFSLESALKINIFDCLQQNNIEKPTALKQLILQTNLITYQTPKELLDFIIKYMENQIYLTTYKMEKFVYSIKQQQKMLNSVQKAKIQKRLKELQEFFSNCIRILQEKITSIQEEFQQSPMEHLKKGCSNTKYSCGNSLSQFLLKFINNQLIKLEEQFVMIRKIKNNAIRDLENKKDVMHKSIEPCGITNYYTWEKFEDTKIKHLSLREVNDLAREIERYMLHCLVRLD